jgi:hypothetical protein
MRLRKPPGRRFGPPSPIPHFEFNTRCSARPERTFGSSAEGSAALPDRYVRDSQLVSARTTVSFRQTHQDAPLFVRSLGTAPAATPGMAESNNQQPRQIPFSLATVRASSAMKGSLQDGRHASLSAAVSSRILGGDAGSYQASRPLVLSIVRHSSPAARTPGAHAQSANTASVLSSDPLRVVSIRKAAPATQSAISTARSRSLDRRVFCACARTGQSSTSLHVEGCVSTSCRTPNPAAMPQPFGSAPQL